jgi:hypothetical protein
MNTKTTMKLDRLANQYDIPLWTLRKWASERSFPGIIKKGRSIYVDVSKFEQWFLSFEIQKFSGDQSEVN